MPEGEKMPDMPVIPDIPVDDGPKIPDMDDLEAQLAALTANDSVPVQPPAPAMHDFSQFDPQSYQPEIKAAPVYVPQ